MHPFLSDRNQSGVFSKLYGGLRKYRATFFNYVRMSVEAFDELLELRNNRNWLMSSLFFGCRVFFLFGFTYEEE
nr:unnamed protein product [Callosobruchus analis]